MDRHPPAGAGAAVAAARAAVERERAAARPCAAAAARAVDWFERWLRDRKRLPDDSGALRSVASALQSLAGSYADVDNAVDALADRAEPQDGSYGELPDVPAACFDALADAAGSDLRAWLWCELFFRVPATPTMLAAAASVDIDDDADSRAEAWNVVLDELVAVVRSFTAD